jgi:hypothetical protein
MSEQPTDEQLQALRREFEEYWATCLPSMLTEIMTRTPFELVRMRDRCWRSWLYAKGAVEK